MRQLTPKCMALQGLAILGSILLAFSIEAWWSDRQDADEAGRILAALELETIANLAAIAEIDPNLVFQISKVGAFSIPPHPKQLLPCQLRAVVCSCHTHVFRDGIDPSIRIKS